MMRAFINIGFLLLLPMVLFHQHQNAVGVSWVVKPNAFTYGLQGTNISMRWNYKLKTDEQFLASKIQYKDNDLASRHPGEATYEKYIGNLGLPFSISGSVDVTLTVHDAKVSYNGLVCCEVDYKSAAGKLNTEACTTLFTYVLPVIPYHTPDVSSKQGDVIKLQCNATGYPQPSGVWIYRGTNKTIANSFTTSLNIVSKETEGTYCCQATNRFGEQTKCTTIAVTEYQPIRTTLFSQAPYIIKNKRFQAQCTADGSPPPYFIFKQNNTQMKNSTSGVYKSDKINADDAVQVSCVPWNKYGSGPEEKIVIPVLVPELPKLSSDLRTSYNLTANSMNLTCRATGNPAPNISWTQEGSSEVISINEHYEVNFKCTNETLIFYCIAANIAGRIKSPPIKVQIHADSRCTPRDKDGSSIYEPPKFPNDLVTSYNMTTRSINITCRATGIPKPRITWTKGDSKDIISTKEYYEVPFKKYDKSKLVFYCHASNMLRKVRSSEIQVHVIQGYNTGFFKICQVGLNRIDNKIAIVIGVALAVVLLMAIGFVVLSRIWITGTSRIKETKEPVEETIDSIPITVIGKVGEVVPHHEQHYSTIDEVEYKKKRKPFFKGKKESPAKKGKSAEKKDEDPVYAVVKKPRTKETA